MKIRTDFVTNSSSSSFVTIHISGTKLMEILKRHQDVFKDFKGSAGDIKIGEDFSFTEEEQGFYEGPPTVKELVAACFSSFIVEYFNEEYYNYEANSDSGALDDLISELKENESEINETLTFLSWCKEVGGWGDSYSDDGDDIDGTSTEEHLAEYDGKKFKYS